MTLIAGKQTIDKKLPRDSDDVPMMLVPPVVALAEVYDTTISASTTVTFNAATTILEVSAITNGIFMKWGGVASSSSFDEFIQAGSTRNYVIPNNASTGALYTTAQFIEQSAGAALVVIEK